MFESFCCAFLNQFAKYGPLLFKYFDFNTQIFMLEISFKLMKTDKQAKFEISIAPFESYQSLQRYLLFICIFTYYAIYISCQSSVDTCFDA